MPEEILVIEYEPRYTERVKHALSGQRFTPLFARDGDEAIKALDSTHPRLIVLSSVVPKISTSELIRQIRTREQSRSTPILLTMSGYTGSAPAADAVRMGATDILPKPYTEMDFLGKVHSVLGLDPAAEETWIGGVPDLNLRKPELPKTMTDDKKQPMTSAEIFGDLLTDEKTQAIPKARPKAGSEDALDKMLADTLSGARVPSAKKRTDTAPVPALDPRPAAEVKQRSDIDKLLEDTLSGLEKTVRARPAEPAAPPQPPPVAPPPPAAPFTPPTVQEPMPEKVMEASPVLRAPFPEASATEEEADSEGIRFGQYLLLEKIATGGMAEVWKARMRGVEGFQKTVAIKKILPHLSDNEEFVTMFVDEAKLAAQLNHNNIIHIYDLGRIASSYYIAMEYIDGHDLKTILRRGEERGQPVPMDLALFIASKIAAALDYAHRKRDFNEKEMGLVHRDVSPQNVLISQEGDIKLCDFGIAKAASKASHTQAGALKGKLQYMSPEQAWGRSIDRRSDIFALAAVLFEMLTARKLFLAENEMSILEQVREARVVPPSTINDEITPDIDRIVLKALARDPDQRYQTAGDMARDLDGILYSIRPTPTSADLAIYMHRLSASEASPLPETAVFEEAVDDARVIPIAPVAAPAPTPVAAPHHAPAAAPRTVVETPVPAHVSLPPSEPATKKKFPVVPVAAVVLVAAVGIGGWFALKGRGSAPAPGKSTPAATTPASAQPTASDTAAQAALAPTTTAPGLATTTGTQTDEARIDEEVRKRLDAERLKLEQQRQQQAAAAAKTQAAATAAATQPAQQQAAPPPVTQTVAQTRSEPEPAPPPVSQPAAQQAAAQAAAPSVREGDLVSPGTEGLVAPELVKPFVPAYPPLARQQRVTGNVIISALISETGKVLDAKILRGVPLLNDAALEAVRRSTFKPATKDGVRVRSYKTMTVPFKL